MRHCHNCEGLRGEGFSIASGGGVVSTCNGCGQAFPAAEQPAQAPAKVVSMPTRGAQSSAGDLVQTARDRLATVEAQIASLTEERKTLRRIVKAAK